MHVWSMVAQVNACVCLSLSRVNSRESRAARRKNRGDHSELTEPGDSPKKEDLTLSLSGEL